MVEIVADCPRCGAGHVTLNVVGANKYKVTHGWCHLVEVYSICRRCNRGSILVGEQKEAESEKFVDSVLKGERGTIDRYFNITGFISLKDTSSVATPEHLPNDISVAFGEATTCLAVQCWSAAGAMFRKCLDLAVLPLLDAEGAPKPKAPLGQRLEWLFKNGKLSRELETLADCVREDGNDGVHGAPLTKADATDLLDFTTELLERQFTLPKRLELAQERRAGRRLCSRPNREGVAIPATSEID